MKHLLKFIFRFILFWMGVFFLNRIVFLLSASSFFADTTFSHELESLVSGFLLDLSTIGYLLPLPGALFTLSVIFPVRWIARLSNAIVSVFIVIYCMICFGELFLYQEWTTKLTMQALLHFKHPGEVFRTAQLHISFLFFFLTIVFSTGYILFYQRRVAVSISEEELTTSTRQKIILTAMSLLVFAPVNFLMIRGGWRAIPVSDSEAYYSPNHVLNDAAVNPLWSLAHNILEYTTHQETNPYVFMSEEEADAGLKKMLAVEKDTTAYFLTTEKPNIVFLILEGFTAYALPNFDGDNYAPFLDSISREGISLTRCYAAAYASDQGIPAILSGYPSTPKISITNQSSKTKNLPSVGRDFKSLGYETGFIFGGQLNYGNIKSYLYNTQFDVVLERDDFPESVPDGHLGIHDGDMVPFVITSLGKAKQPFLYSWFTISTHSPYDIPVPIKKITGGRENDYMNTIIYSDKAIGDFFSTAKKEPWYSNTLFIIISDHSHFCQREIGIEDKEYHRIVSFFYGDVIKPEYRGKKIGTITSQLDIAPTLVKQFHLSDEKYDFGKNVMNPYSPSFAYYDYHYGSGFVTDSCYVSRKKDEKDVFVSSCKDSAGTGQLKRQHEIFLEKSFLDYLSR